MDDGFGHDGGRRDEYFRAYYELNRDDILRKRKERYWGEPTVRRKNVWKQREWRERTADRRAKAAQERRQRPWMIPVGGEMVEAFGTADVAVALGIRRDQVSAMVSRGAIPATPYRGGHGAHLYSRSMIDVVSAAVMGEGGDGVVRRKIEVGWRRLGVSGEKTPATR